MRKWQSFAAKREQLGGDVRDLKKELGKIENTIAETGVELRKQKSRSANARRDAENANNTLKASVDDYQFARAEFQRVQPQAGVTLWTFVAMIALAAIAAVGYVFVPNLWVAITSALALIAGLMTGVSLYRSRRLGGDVEARAADLIQQAKSLSLKFDTVDDLSSVMSDLDQRYEKEAERERELTEHLQVLTLDRDRIVERMQTRKDDIVAVDAELAIIRTGTDMETVTEFQAALAQRRDALATKRAKVEVLGTLLGDRVASTPLDELAMQIETRLNAYRGSAQPTTDADIDRLEAELLSLNEHAEALATEARAGSRRLHDIEVRTRAVAALDYVPPCRTAHSLTVLATSIRSYIYEVRTRQEHAQTAIRIFDDIAAAEKERVRELFGRDSLASRWFNKVTGGRYSAVRFNVKTSRVEVESANGDLVDASALSGGAFDQLYLCLRLTVATALLDGQKAFLILDDPFVKSDNVRLEEALSVLKDFVASGWQVIYVTAKGEVVDALRDDIGRGTVKIIPLDKPTSPRTPKAVTPDDPSWTLFD